jgi:hypothetical protein
MYIHAYIPWIHKFVTATIGYGISHETLTKTARKLASNQY